MAGSIFRDELFVISYYPNMEAEPTTSKPEQCLRQKYTHL